MARTKVRHYMVPNLSRRFPSHLVLCSQFHFGDSKTMVNSKKSPVTCPACLAIMANMKSDLAPLAKARKSRKAWNMVNEPRKLKMFIATIRVLIDANELGEAEDGTWQLMSNPGNGIIDWAYDKAPRECAKPKDYEEGDLLNMEGS